MRKCKVVLVLLITLIGCQGDKSDPAIQLNGSSEITIEVNTSYQDLGASALYGKSEVDVITTGVVDVTTIGTYYLYYNASVKDQQAVQVTRTIHVVDTTPPTIEYSELNSIYISYGADDISDFIDVTDNYYGKEDIEIVVVDDYNHDVLGNDTITIYARDASNNRSSEKTLTIIIEDTEAPFLSFSELDDFTHEQGVPFSNDYLILYDDYDDYDDITLVVTGEVDINILGEYDMSYYAIDTSGNQSEIIHKTVSVIAKEDLDYYERYMKNHTSLYDATKFVNSYIYDPTEKVYRGLVLNNLGEYEIVYYMFYHNLIDDTRVLKKFEFIQVDGENYIYELEDEIIDYVIKLPIEFAFASGSMSIKTYAHDEFSEGTTWTARFYFGGLNNLDVDYLLSLEFKAGNLK